MSAFEPVFWEEARRGLEEDLPQHPESLPREALAGLASRLRGAGWSYGDIALALAQPKTSVYRWVKGSGSKIGQTASESRAGGGVAALIGLGIAIALGYSAYRGASRPPQPVSGLRVLRTKGEPHFPVRCSGDETSREPGPPP